MEVGAAVLDVPRAAAVEAGEVDLVEGQGGLLSQRGLPLEEGAVEAVDHRAGGGASEHPIDARPVRVAHQDEEGRRGAGPVLAGQLDHEVDVARVAPIAHEVGRRRCDLVAVEGALALAGEDGAHDGRNLVAPRLADRIRDHRRIALERVGGRQPLRDRMGAGHEHGVDAEAGAEVELFEVELHLRAARLLRLAQEGAGDHLDRMVERQVGVGDLPGDTGAGGGDRPVVPQAAQRVRGDLSQVAHLRVGAVLLEGLDDRVPRGLADVAQVRPGRAGRVARSRAPDPVSDLQRRPPDVDRDPEHRQDPDEEEPARDSHRDEAERPRYAAKSAIEGIPGRTGMSRGEWSVARCTAIVSGNDSR